MDTRLIQLQPDRFLFNWRFRESQETYPRYPEIAKSFHDYLELFEKFIGEANIGLIEPTIAELTYINILEEKTSDVAATTELTDRIFRDFQWGTDNERFLPKPSTLNWVATFALPENRGVLKATLARGTRAKDKQPIVQFDLAASGQVNGQPRAEIDAWYALAHEWIVKGFVDLTKPDVQQKMWGREQ